jgi:hypothetical protein
LAKANRNRAKRPWLFAMTHHPLYCSVNNYIEIAKHTKNSDCGIDTAILRPFFEEMMYEHGVDVFI